MISGLVVDDEAPARRKLRGLLEREDGFEVVDEAADALLPKTTGAHSTSPPAFLLLWVLSPPVRRLGGHGGPPLHG